MNEENGYEINYPPTWVIRPAGELAVLSNVSELSELSETALQTESFFGIRLHTGKNPNLLPINQWFDQFFAEGFAVDPLSRTSILVDNREAVRIETIEVGGQRIHIYVSMQSDVIEISYGLFAPQFVDEYETMLNSFQFTQ